MKTRSPARERAWHVKTCQICQDGFRARRADTRYCSDACKQSAYRLRKSTP